MEDLIKDVLGQIQGATILATDALKAPVVAIPDNLRLVSLEDFADTPTRITGNTNLYRFSDFVSHVNAFKTDSGRVFVAPNLAFDEGITLATAYLDYPAPGLPSWTTHTAQLKVSCSLPYKLITELDGLLMDQNLFAQKIKDVARYCLSMSQADLIELARTLTLSSKGNYASVEDDFSGSINLSYDVQVSAKSDATARQGVEVPREISFQMPVLQGGEDMTIVAELVYRTPKGAGEKVQMGIRLPDRKFVEREVLESTAVSIENMVSLPVVLGETSVPRQAKMLINKA